jgi:hypothetical protein
MNCLATQTRATVLVLPGWHGSGPAHWQTRWQAQYPDLIRVEQRDWVSPRRDDWVDQLDRAVDRADGPVYFVAHSLGCIALAHWANVAGDLSNIAGALFVSPPCFLTPGDAPRAIQNFFPVPTARLAFTSILVASENDPYVTYSAAARLARAWGSELVSAGRAGHINVESGHGDWPEGERLLDVLLSANTAAALAFAI